MALLRLTIVYVFGLLGTTWGLNFYIAAPAKLRLNAEQTIGIVIDGRQSAITEVYIQDHPDKLKNITHAVITVQPDEPTLFKINLDPANFPPEFFNSPGSEKLVSVRAASDEFQKEILVPITMQSGYVFIQMDKPIYNPNQRAQIRIISLNEETLPSNKHFRLQIKNPGGVIVEETLFNKTAQRPFKSFDTHIYKFPSYSNLGEWSATVRYGYEFQQETSVYFELEEYDLPTFTLEMKTPAFILPSTDIIKIGVRARHVYGKSVQGIVTFRIGIKRNSPNINFFSIITSKKLDQGSYEVKISTDDLKKHSNIGWFPAIEGAQLAVEAIVVDDATGNIEKSMVINTVFSKSPFVISFKRCLPDFKPGFNSIFEADITYVDGKPAEGILTKIKVVADGDKPLEIDKDSAVSNDAGKVIFEMQPYMIHSLVSVTLETNDSRYVGSQTVGQFVQRRFQSRNNAYISIDRGSAQRLQPGDMFTKLIYVSERVQDIYYVIISKGNIIALNKLPAGPYKLQSIKFQITHEMVPFFRLVVFAQYRGELIADSLKVDVERVCDPTAEISVESEFHNKEPGAGGRLNFIGTYGTWIGLTSTDESVYFLSQKDLLTKAKMFDTLASHDFGCGPGGGLSVSQVLQNAGIIIGTNLYTPTLVSTNGTGLKNQQCALEVQEDKFNRHYRVRKSIGLRKLEEHNNYSKAFENGINERYNCRHKRDLFDDLDFIGIEDEDDFEKDMLIRNDFRETHIFEDIMIGSSGKRSFDVNLPHAITTWVVSAVSVSPQNGMCVAEPQKLVSFKKIFLNLNLPYSAVINEQIEIQATVFNYGDRPIPATIYMHGVKDLCTGIQTGQKSERRYLIINPYSSKSVMFPVIPLKVQSFQIKMVVLTPEGGDVVQRNLQVLPEGITEEVQIAIKLDPTNSQQRRRFMIVTDVYTDAIDSSINHQVTSVKLQYPENIIPGTARCWITAIGDKVVETAVVESNINNPDALLQKPQGSGEQNMVLLAPTLYVMIYLKATGKITAAREAKGYEFILTGYINQLTFKKQDGTYASSLVKPTSTWLTTFVMKVFSQLNKLVPMDRNALCSGVRWLINNQAEDGSYVEKNPIDDRTMMGGVQGSIPMTAFVIIALEESKCHGENLIGSKNRAVTYLEEQLSSLREPFPLAIVTYALVLSNSELKGDANNKLLSMAKNDKDENLMYWETQNSEHDIETAGYGLLTQLFFNDMKKISSIVNWLNIKQLQSGSGKFTQDTVIALQSLSEYATHSKTTRSINLVSNMSLSNDRFFKKTLVIDETNVNVLQSIKIDKVGGMLFINTAGYGVANLTVIMRYNRIPPLACKFDVTVEVSEAKKEDDEMKIVGIIKPTDIFDSRVDEVPNLENGDPVGAVSTSQATPKNSEEETPDLVNGDTVGAVPVSPATPKNREAICERPLAPDHGTLHVLGDLKVNSFALYMCDDARKLVGASASKCLITGEWTSPPPKCVDKSRVRRQVPVQDNKIKFVISICTKYLGDKDAENSVVEVGIFSGYEPDVSKLEELKSDPTHLIQRYEKSGKSVVFHLQKVPTAEKYCFSFPIIRRYITGQKQIGVIKMYDYYNPHENCRKWYTTPGSDSPLLHTICEGSFCQCAEGGCPSDRALMETASLGREQRRSRIVDMICENYDYAWRGQVDGLVSREKGFFNINFTIEEVIKEGTEKRFVIEGESRILILRDNCPQMFPGQTYMIIGKDGQKYRDNEGIAWYRYILDNNSIVYMWTSVQTARNPELQRALFSVRRTISSQGCSLL